MSIHNCKFIISILKKRKKIPKTEKLREIVVLAKFVNMINKK